jgi:AraC-like DNA-binding protein
LFGSYHDLGFSFEWHEFTALKEFDWAKSFHPGSIELCLNLGGKGTVSDSRLRVELLPQTYTFYHQGEPSLTAVRQAGDLHRFITIEFSPSFLREHFTKQADNLHPLIRAVVRDDSRDSEVVPSERLSTTLQQLVESLRHCPVFNPAQEMWFRCKALEVAAHLFFRPVGGEMFCTRAQRLARERVEQAKMILKGRLQNPPSLEELSRLVHCSSFYLSRLFTQEGGVTMQQYLRHVRMERAAELLRTGRCNVTEAALEVGYSSLSHFSSTFHETFGCCPGLYPLKTPTQRTIDVGKEQD